MEQTTLTPTRCFVRDLADGQEVNEVYVVRERRMGVNYGLDEVRFGSPVAAGARVRAAVDLRSLTDVEGGAQLVLHVTVEVDGLPDPACTAAWISRIYR